MKGRYANYEYMYTKLLSNENKHKMSYSLCYQNNFGFTILITRY